MAAIYNQPADQLIEKILKYNISLILAFVHDEKSFDSVEIAAVLLSTHFRDPC